MQGQLSSIVREALEEAALTLGAALDAWWPTTSLGQNRRDGLTHKEVPEATVRMHISAALVKRGLLVYAEVPFDGNDNGNGNLPRVDMLAIRGSGTNVEIALIELKRFISGEKASAMAADWRRLQAVRWPEGVGFPKLSDCAAVCRAIVGTTWNQRYASWWNSGLVGVPERVREGLHFSDLRNAVRGATTFSVTVPRTKSVDMQQVMVVALS
jgi:hypothetical protein